MKGTDYIMKHGFFKGMVTGAAIGAGIAMFTNASGTGHISKRKMQKNASNFFGTIGSIADNFMSMHR